MAEANSVLTFVFPLKGLNEETPYRTQPGLTTPRALNVMPFDASGRGRGGSRRGTAKLYADFQGDGTEPVYMMVQTVIALDPSGVQEGVVLLTENFTYADQALTAANANWRTSNNSVSVGLDSGVNVTTANSIRVLANRAEVALSATDDRNAAVYNAALAMGSTYIVSAMIDCYDTTVSGDPETFARHTFCLFSRVDRSAFGSRNQMVILSYNLGVLTLQEGEGAVGGATHAFSPPLDGNIARLVELRIVGQRAEAWVDGVNYITLDLSDVEPATPGVGFSIGDLLTGTDNLDTFKVATAVPITSTRRVNLITNCGGNVYVGDAESFVEATGGHDVLRDNVRSQAAFFERHLFIVDGFEVVILNVLTQTVLLGGFIDLPDGVTGTPPEFCQLAALWRGRLVLAAPREAPQNWFMSAIGQPGNWDYSGTDVGRAVASNGSVQFGTIGDGLVAIAPYDNDTMLFFTDRGIYQLTGDPADGGTMTSVSDQVGGLGPNCWTRDAAGTIYFAGTSGFYRMSPGGAPECISNATVNEFFRQINRATQWVTVVWDRDRFGAWIFVTNQDAGQASNHMWFDARTEGFFTQRFPAEFGPVAALAYDGDAAADRWVFMGGREGFIQRQSVGAFSDDGTPIESEVILGPVRPVDDLTEGKIIAAMVYLAEDGGETQELTITFQAADDAQKAVNDPDATEVVSYQGGGKQAQQRLRLRGGNFAIKVSNDVLDRQWAVERIVCQFARGARQR